MGELQGKGRPGLSAKRLALLKKLSKKEGLDSPAFPVISPRDKSQPLPLSFAQQRLWFLDQMQPGISAYNIPIAMCLKGELNVSALERSIVEIIRRHEILRTTFHNENDKAVQSVGPVADIVLKQIDLSSIEGGKRQVKARQLALEEASLPFNLALGPLFRATLIQLEPAEHVLLITVHHIISDGWSTGVLYRELATLYDAFSKGESSPLPELPVQYGDFTVWQKEWFQGERLDKQLQFWKETLRAIDRHEITADKPRPSMQTFNGATCTFHFDKGVTEALQSLSRDEGATLFMTMLAAFQTMLHRYTGQDDIVIGTPVANRNRVETNGMIGFFLNTLVVRADTSGNPSFREMLLRAKQVLLDSYSHQELPFEKLVEELQPDHDLSRNPLFQVLFTLLNVRDINFNLPGIAASPMEVQNNRTRFDLEVHIEEGSEGLKGAFIYNTDLFEAATIERMAGHYKKLLEGIVADPDQRLSDLPLLTDSERNQLLAGWNDTITDYPEDKRIHELFEQQVKTNSHVSALVFEDRQLTYRELNSKANQLAHYLRKQGVGPDVPVGICVERSIEMVVSVLAVLKAGGTYVPLDPAYPKERLELILEDVRALLVITQKSLSGALPVSKGLLINIDQDWAMVDKESDQNPDFASSPRDLAYVLYTSGSTGKPKGVAMGHRPLCNLISWQLRNSKLASGARTLQFASLNFDVSFQEIFSTLCSGGTLTVITEELRRDPFLLSRYLESESIERLFLPFVALQQLAEAMDKSNLFPKSLKEVITAGEQLRTTPAIVRMFEGLRECRLYNQYGPTESHVVTAFELSGVPADWSPLPPIGRPISNTEIYILDRYHNPVAVGNAGELYIGGECLAREYMNQPEMTGEKFIANPFSQMPGSRLYKTGDLARYLPDGNIEYLGRIDNQVKVRGFRIEPGEVEAVLAKHHEVKDVAVTAYGNGTENKRLAAYILCDSSSQVTADELRSFLSEKLPEYMVPSAFMLLDSFPLTPSGKVDRRSLPEPGHHIAGEGALFVPPRNELEVQLAKIWEKVLDVKPVGIRDNFFHLGGHSILAVPLMSEINKVTGNDLPVISIFHSPTIEQLVKVLQGEELPGPLDTIAPIQPHGSNAPLFWLTGTYFVRHMEPDQPVYMLIDWDEHGYIPGYSTIEEIAALCIQRLRDERPEGPYILGGYCFWGAVALEVAQQLMRQGHKVPLLFLVDTSVKYSGGKSKGSGQGQVSSTNNKSGVMRHVDSLKRLGTKEKISYVLQNSSTVINWAKRNTVDRLRRKTKVAVCRTCLYFGRPVPRRLVQFYVYQVYAMKLLNEYAPQSYPGRVVLIGSDRDDGVVRPDWTGLIAGDVHVHKVPDASHADLIKEPYVANWAERLRFYLKKSR